MIGNLKLVFSRIILVIDITIPPPIQIKVLIIFGYWFFFSFISWLIFQEILQRGRIKFVHRGHTVFFSLRWGLAVSQARVQWCHHDSMQPQTLGSHDPPTSASWVCGPIGTCYHTWLIFLFVEMRSHYVAQAELKQCSCIGLPGAGILIVLISCFKYFTHKYKLLFPK